MTDQDHIRQIQAAMAKVKVLRRYLGDSAPTRAAELELKLAVEAAKTEAQ